MQKGHNLNVVTEIIDEIAEVATTYVNGPTAVNGLYFTQPGKAARNVSVERAKGSLRLVVAQGFWHSAVRREPVVPAAENRLKDLGFSDGGRSGNYRRTYRGDVEGLATIIVDILSTGWGKTDAISPDVLTRSPAVQEFLRRKGRLAAAIPGLPSANEVASPSIRAGLRLALKLISVRAGTNEPITSEIVACPGGVEPDNLMSYVALTFGKPLDRALSTTSDGKPLQVGWVYPHSVFAQIGRAAPPTAELLVIPGSYRLDDGEWTSLFLHLAGQRRLFEGLLAHGEISSLDRVTMQQAGPNPDELLADG